MIACVYIYSKIKYISGLRCIVARQHEMGRQKQYAFFV